MAEADVGGNGIQFEAIEGEQLPVFTAINSGKRIETKNTGNDAFGFDVGQSAGWNREFFILKSARNLIAGQFHVSHAVSERLSQRAQPLAPVELHNSALLRDILPSDAIVQWSWRLAGFFGF